MLHTKESNILEAIYDPKGPNCRIAELIREQYKRGIVNGFGGTLCSKLEKAIDKALTPKLIEEAKEEAIALQVKLTDPFFLIGQAFQKQVFGGEDVEHIQIINGTFTDATGKKVANVVIPTSFGGNPYGFFRYSSPGSNLDETITNVKAKGYLEKDQGKLLALNYTHLVINSSVIFFIPYRDLAVNFLDNHGEIDMHMLLPFITNIPYKGTIMTRNPVRPDESTFLSLSPNLLSARLKGSPLKKLMRKFSEKNPILEKDVIHDVIAFRKIVDDLGKAYEFQESLNERYFIGANGEYEILNAILKDRFKQPKYGFEALVNQFKLKTKKGEEYPVEVQVQTKPKIYENEIKCDPASSVSRERKQKRGEQRPGEVLSPGLIHLNDFVEDKLESVYGRPTRIDIKTLKIIPPYDFNHY